MCIQNEKKLSSQVSKLRGAEELLPALRETVETQQLLEYETGSCAIPQHSSLKDGRQDKYLKEKWMEAEANSKQL